MAEGDFLDDLSYSGRERKYVAPPQSRQILLRQKEQDYLQATENKQVLEGMLTNLPYAPQDKPLYQELVNSTNSFLGSINPENMADSILNTKQFASDFVNKKGGKQLVDNYTQYQGAIKAIDENKGIADPAMRDWYKKQIKVNPVTKSEVTGMYQAGKVDSPNVADFYDTGAELVKLFEGMKADGSFTQNADGSVKINKPVPGYLQYNVGENVSIDRLKQGLLGYINSNPKATSYMTQRANYLASGMDNSIQGVFNRFTPSQRKTLLGNENATASDYLQFLSRTSSNPQEVTSKNSSILKQIVASEEVQNAMLPAISKYVYSSDKPVLIEDKMLMESLKFQADLAKAKKEKPADDDLSSSSIQGWNTIQAVNPADVAILDTRRTELKQQLPNKQAELMQYSSALNNKLPGYTVERLNQLNAEVQSLDKEVEEVELQKKQVTDGVIDIARKQGIDIEEEYKKSLPELRKIAKDANNLILKRDKLTGMIDENGEVTNGRIAEQYNTIVVPTLEEYKDLVTKSYINPKGFVDNIANDRVGTNGQNIDNYAFSYKDKDTVKKLQKLAGEFKDIKVTKDLSYINIEGETTKQSLKAYTNYLKNIQTNFSNNPESFKVGDKAIGQFLEEELEIDNLRTMIDWSGTKITPLLQRDRNNGQLYGVNLKLTEKGEKELDNEEKYALTNAIKVPVTYHGINKDIQDNEVQHVITTAFKDMMGADRTPHTIDLMKSAGEMYINTSPIGKTIDSMNLYVLPAGQTRQLDIDGESLEIQSVARTARGGNINNTDFRVFRGSGDNKEVLINDANGSKWAKYKQVQNDGSIIDFNSPSDIKQVIGAGLLYKNISKSKAEDKEPVNPYEQYLNSNTTSYKQAGYKLVSDIDIQTQNYNQYKASLQTYYRAGGQNISLQNNSGKQANIVSRVPLNDLSNIKDIVGSNISPSVVYPYVNKNVVNNLKDIVDSYNVMITGGFRGETTHAFLPGSNKNSPHKYGYGVDFEDNDNGNNLFNAVKADPALANQLGIARILKEGDHIHVEFKTNMI